MAQSNGSSALRIALWVARVLVAIPFCFFGFMKLTAPVQQLVEQLQIKWAGELPLPIVRGLGVIDLAGGLGLILPLLTGIKPQLSWYAAIGSTALQICAITFHASRGEFAVLPLNYVLICLTSFIVVKGRQRLPVLA